MKSIFRPFCIAATRCALTGLLVLAAAMVAPVAAAPVDLTNLLRNSPFGVPKTAKADGGIGDAPLEFRGLLVEGGRHYFSVREAKGKQSHWIELNEAGNAFTARKYDESSGTLTVEYQGMLHTLALKEAVVVAISAPGDVAHAIAKVEARETARPGNGIGAGADGARRNRAILQARAATAPQRGASN